MTHVDQFEATVLSVITSTVLISLHNSSQIAKYKLGIRVTDVAIGLRRIPAGFYVEVQHNGLEWRTTNKPVSVNTDVVEWAGPIPM